MHITILQDSKNSLLHSLLKQMCLFKDRNSRNILEFIDILPMPTLDIRGEGKNTTSLVDAVIKIVKNIFEVVTKHGSLKAAIMRGYKIHKYHIEECRSPDDCFPCTTVHELVKGFSLYLDDIS